MSESETVLAWHFLPDDGCLRWGTREKVEVGKTYTVDGPLVMCWHGLHASVTAIDALGYAPGAIACRVQLSGKILRGDDKVVATHRTVLAMVDATKTLHEFACWCAETALERERKAGREPAARSWAAIAVKRRWLVGQATDAELAVAGAAAWDAASAAWVVAGAVAGAAAWAAAGNAAWAAAGDAASAARAAAWAAARTSQNERLTLMLCELLEMS